MATSGATLPIERNYLLKAWLMVAGIVIVAVATIVLAIATTGAEPAGGNGPGSVQDFGRPSVTHQPLQINGTVCGQCR